jgi:hypothetical protein
MSLKSIELQIAIPRTKDFGKMQEQQNQRPAVQLHQDSEEQKAKLERERMQSMKLEQKKNAQIEDDEHSSGGQQQQHSRQNRKKKTPPSAPEHPFKGKHIDLSL